jgi:hypothetical protein
MLPKKFPSLYDKDMVIDSGPISPGIVAAAVQREG